MSPAGRLCAHGAIALAPLLFLQGWSARARIVPLPEAAGPRRGRAAAGAPDLHLWLIGESTVAGVGVADHSVGLAGQTARTLAGLTGRTVNWRVDAANGLTAALLGARLDDLSEPPRAEVVLVGLGANDVFRLHGPRRWCRDLAALDRRIRQRCGPVPVLLSAVPPIGQFPALPQPLRAILGLRATLLDEAAAGFARRHADVHRLELDFTPAAELFCADGIHPSAQCYARWGAAAATAAAALLARR